MNERIWIYTISKLISNSELEELNALCKHFVSNWTAHEVSLDASYELFQNRLLIFKVNEAKYNASGCSIDKQLRFVKDLEQKFQTEFLNRMLVAYRDREDILQITPQSNIKELLQTNIMTADTIVYNNTITHSSDLQANWAVPLKTTWLSKYLEIKTV